MNGPALPSVAMSSSANPDHRLPARPWLAAATMTLAAWLVAFGVVTALLTGLGDELGALPLALRALVISGALVALMVNLVMPVLNKVIPRWVRGASEAHAPARGGSHPHPSRCSMHGYPIDVGMAVRMGDLADGGTRPDKRP
jgi:hypothetical protein